MDNSLSLSLSTLWKLTGQCRYTHVAETAAEKRRVGRLLCQTMAYIVDNGYFSVTE